MTDWQTDKRWSDRYIPALKEILARNLAQFIRESPLEEDRSHNTDLVVLRLDPIRVACRVRQNRYMQRFSGEITLRTARPNGTETELAKLLSGWGDYFLYGFAHPDPDRLDLVAWTLVDLARFRLWFHRWGAQHGGHWPGTAQTNRDGSSEFLGLSVASIDPACILERIPAGPVLAPPPRLPLALAPVVPCPVSAPMAQPLLFAKP